LWIDGKSLRLPDLALEILPSIGRARVLELAVETGLTPAPGRYGVDALGGKPVFLVNAVRGVVPVASLDGVQTPSHSAVARLAAAFWPSS
jgi:branched-subunit amino acid aminotransferase/4-amino-4-deoxychorismate lyase